MNRIPIWQVAGLSVRGAKHRQRGEANQDAALYRVDAASGVALIAVADGHGGAPYHRSAVGAQLAVDAAAQVLIACFAAPASLAAASQTLPHELLLRWRAAVDADLALHPRDSAAARLDNRRQPFLRYLPYGATLIAAGLRGGDLVILQVGDGEAALMTEDAAPHPLLPKDPRLGAGPTTSLCTPDAARQCRVAVIRLGTDTPPGPWLLALTTDGWRNCHLKESDFAGALATTRALAAAHGPQPLCDHLESWLTLWSAQGSGDDCSLALAWSGELPAAAAADEDASRTIERQLAALTRQQSTARHQLRAGLGLVLAVLACWLVVLAVSRGATTKPGSASTNFNAIPPSRSSAPSLPRG